MYLLLLSMTTVDLILILMGLLGAIIIIKRQDKSRQHYFLFKKRTRIIREFKDLYYSYTIYRENITDDEYFFIREEKINQLIRNHFWDKEPIVFEDINLQQEMSKLQGQLDQLDLLSDDFEILYNNPQTQPIQSFLFWYRSLIKEIALYKKDLIEGQGDFSGHPLLMKNKLKHLEESFQLINEKSTLRNLTNQARFGN